MSTEADTLQMRSALVALAKLPHRVMIGVLVPIAIAWIGAVLLLTLVRVTRAVAGGGLIYRPNRRDYQIIS